MLQKPYLNHLGVEADYNAIDALHYSTLKLLTQSVRAFKEKTDEEDNEEDRARMAKHFLIGGGVDTLLTDFNSFDNKYISFSGKVAGDKADLVLRKLVEYSLDLETISDDYLQNVCHIEGFYTNWKGASHRKELLKNKEYFEFLQKANGKVILDTKSYDAIFKTYYRIINGKYTKPFIDNMCNNSKLRVYPQFALVANIMGIQYKGLLDYCIFNDETSTITIVDAKTLWKHSNQFPKQYEWLRYGLQAAGYYLLVKELFPLYQNVEYKFIVESTNEKLTSPVIYEVSPELMFEELYGNTDKRKIGFSELISTYLFHNYTDEWIYDKNVIDSNGIITLTQWS